MHRVSDELESVDFFKCCPRRGFFYPFASVLCSNIFHTRISFWGTVNKLRLRRDGYILQTTFSQIRFFFNENDCILIKIVKFLDILMFSFLLAWTNWWTNNSVAGDLRRHETHVTSGGEGDQRTNYYDDPAWFIYWKWTRENNNG